MNQHVKLDRRAFVIGTAAAGAGLSLGLDIPFEFTCWVLETPLSDLIGWHWPGLHGEHSRDRHDALGVDFISAMMFSLCSAACRRGSSMIFCSAVRRRPR